MVDSASVQWNLAKSFTFANGPDVDRAVWKSPQWISPTDNPAFFGRTAIRNPTDNPGSIGLVPVVNNAAQLRLSTYNPDDPSNQTFLGAQISTIEKWGRSKYSNVAFEANVLSPSGSGGVPGGAVTAFFTYNLLSTTPFQHDEIDFEFASNWWSGPNEAVNTNIYLDSNSGIDQVVPTKVDFSRPITFRIEWGHVISHSHSRTYIRWLINGQPVRVANQAPSSDMSLVFNFWVPDSTWNWAYNSNLQPTGQPGAQQWNYQVNWAKVYTA